MVAFGRVSVAAAAICFLKTAVCDEFVMLPEEAFVNNPDKMCEDILNASQNEQCYANVTWAMETGIKSHASFYVNYTELTVNSSRLDFQCVLADMVGSELAGTGWSCPVPCGSSFPVCASATDKDINATSATDKEIAAINATAANATDKDIAATSDEGSGFPWWAWLLVLCPLLLLCGGLAYYFLVLNKKDGAQKKKKRATKAPAPPAAPVVEAAPTESVLVAPPVYVSSTRAAAPVMAAPVYTAAPSVRSMYATATPVQTSASFVAVAAPATYAAPVAQYAAPVATYTAAPVSMFDALDSNHDGVITREEFAAMR